MKKLIFLLPILLFLSNCKTEDDTLVEMELPQENLLLTVNVSETYYANNDYWTTSGEIYLTDNSGELLTDSVLLNDNGYSFNTDIDLGNTPYDVTFLQKEVYNDDGFTFYRLSTFLDMESSTINLFDGVNIGEEARIVILNHPSGGETFTKGSTSSTSNKIDLYFPLKRNPENVFISAKNDNEGFSRYLWLENLTGEAADTIEWSDIPVSNFSSTIQYPENDDVETTVYGITAQEETVEHLFSRERYAEGNLSTVHEYPENFFSEFRTVTYLTKNDNKYYKNTKGTSLPSEVTLPDFDFQVTNSSLDNFTMTSSSDYDYYTINFIYHNIEENYSVAWKVYGISQDIVNFALPNIAGQTLTERPNFSFNDLMYSNSTILKIAGFDTYEDYISFTLDHSFELRNLITSYEYLQKN